MSTQPTFSGIHFWVADMAATIAFYRLCGLPVPEDAGGEFVSFSAGGATFAFGTDALTHQYDPAFEPQRGRRARRRCSSICRRGRR